jgi:hypothetical protein
VPQKLEDEARAKFYHYCVGKGKSSRSACRNCRRQLQKEELRIKTFLIRIFGLLLKVYLLATGYTQRFQVSFCLNTDCFLKGISYYDKVCLRDLISLP